MLVGIDMLAILVGVGIAQKIQERAHVISSQSLMIRLQEARG
jgi:hypothetical protein